ncbi:MFS transporter [Actinomarinicola tropica]|uniref:MFS transporter n=1 Tax=Actinomarinicola tropica TaxID=2789776 RepID=A0A5Q2RCR9_9ACTN|nr:MFS transporter [Actinomarinicola tropica]QGG94679.1 MFS transporter [Actinomarinicola tropica]
MAETPLPAHVRRALPALVGGRLAGNTGIRFVYPFLPAIARGLGVSQETAGVAMSIREMSGLVAPFAGGVIDRGRRRLGMLAGLALSALFLAVAGGAPGIVTFTVAVTAFGAAKIVYDTAMSTWIGHHVPWQRRGTVVGIGEVSWSLALLVGVPLLGLAIDAWGWRSAFWAVAGVHLVAAIAVLQGVVADDDGGGARAPRLRLLPGAVGIYAAMSLLSFAIALVFVAYGFWLEDDIGWDVATIGLASILLGVGELAGTGGAIWFADRIGKRRTVLIGCVGLVPTMALLGPSGARGLTAILVLGAVVTAFELAFVAGLPLITEIDPDARGAGVGTALALITVARSIGTFGGSFLYARLGMGWTGVAAAVGVALAGTIMLLAVREPRAR